MIEIIRLCEIAREDQVFFAPDGKEYTWKMGSKDCEVRLTWFRPLQLLLTALGIQIALLFQREHLDTDCQLSAEGTRHHWEGTACCS